MQKRSGVLAVFVLACLVVAAALMAITVEVAIRARRQTRLEHQMVQTEWLLDAGIRRATVKLRNQPEFKGETWVPSGALERFGSASVEIAVTNDDTSSKQVEVIATIAGSSRTGKSTQRSHRFNLEMKNTETPTAESTDEATTL